ncbi:unnamed protein product [Rhizophagus irregularis]|nr:unnamed protein product [Rhizophagus irregularis]
MQTNRKCEPMSNKVQSEKVKPNETSYSSTQDSKQAVDMTDSLRTIDDVEDVSMEVQVLKLLKDLKKEISYG